MKIGELAQQTGLAPSRIRFYERIGLLKSVERQANGYRFYPADAVLVLGMIVTAQKAGFSLEELRTLLPSTPGQWAHGSLIDPLRAKVKDIEALQAQLAQSRAHLLTLIAQIEAKPQDMDCQTNARRLLSELPPPAPPKPRARVRRAAASCKFNLKTALDAAEGAVMGRSGKARGGRRLHPCEGEQRRQGASGQCPRVRSALTHSVSSLVGHKVNGHHGLQRVGSGQLRFLGST